MMTDVAEQSGSVAQSVPGDEPGATGPTGGTTGPATAAAAGAARTGTDDSAAAARIGDIRERIDEIDQAIIELWLERAALSQEVGATRMASGGTRLVLSREREILDRFRAGPRRRRHPARPAAPARRPRPAVGLRRGFVGAGASPPAPCGRRARRAETREDPAARRAETRARRGSQPRGKARRARRETACRRRADGGRRSVRSARRLTLRGWGRPRASPRSGRRSGGREPGRISSSGSCSAQMSCAFQQRVRNRQPEGGLDRRRHVAGEPDDRLAVPLRSGPAPAPRRAAPGCTGGSAARRSRPRCRSRRSCRGTSPRPGRERCRTTDRSWAMKTYDSPSSSCSRSSRLITCAWIETSSADDRLVADDDLGPQGERAGDADALALAAGELVRVPVDVLRVEPDQVEQLLHLAPAAALRRHLGVDLERLADEVTDGHPRVQRGVRVLHDHLDLPAQSPQRRRRRAWRCPGPVDAPLPAVGFSRLISTRASVDLPQPDSPTTPSVSPARRSNETPSTALTWPMVFLNTTPWVTG